MTFPLSLRPARRWLTLAILATAAPALAAQGQSAVIGGRVLTSSGQPLTGANVFITELNVSVGTNAAGRYTITIPGERVRGQSATLRIRSIGFKPETRPITISAGNQTADFTLAEDVNRLESVVVTGVAVGTSQRTVPFAISRMDTTQMPVVGADAVSQLQGKVAGANIQAASGRPGAAPSVVLRGPTSINAGGRGQGPLYIVDGVILNGPTPALNPSDIENIEIVKGAAAASLYGARAGGGVINITTKSGKTATEGVTFGMRSEYGLSSIPHQYAMAQQTHMAFDPTGQYFCATATSGGSPCARYIDVDAERRRVNDVATTNAISTQSFLYDYGLVTNPGRYRALMLFQANDFAKSYNQVDQATKTDRFSNTNFDLRGKIGSTGFFGSVSDTRQAGAFEFLDGYKRNTARLNVDQLIGNKVSLQATTFYSASTEDGGNQDGGTAFFRLSRSPAFVDQSVRDQLGRLYIRSNPLAQGFQNANPLYYLEQYDQKVRGTRFLGSMQAKYTATDWLDFNGDVAYDRATGYATWQQDRGFRTTEVDASTANGFIQNTSSDSSSINASVGVAARPRLFANLNSTVTGQVLYDAQNGLYQFGYGQNLAVPGLLTLNAASVNKDIQSSTADVRALSYRTGLDLEYAERYILSLSARREGSSLFGQNNRWATFPRVAGAWIASSEPWWPLPQLTLAKARLAWGKAGQRPNSVAQYETFSVSRTTGALSPATLGNTNLRPEILTEVEVGTDLELFGRYGFNLTYAKSVAEDQILQVPAPASSGFPQQWRNAGQLTNRTLELALDIPLINRNDMRWSTRMVYDRNRAVITRLDVPAYNTTGGVQASDAMFLVREGERLGTIYGRAFITSCDQLPGVFAGQCGGAGSQFQQNNQGFIVWTGGLNPGEGITRNAWNASLNPANAPWNTRTVFGMPIMLRDSVNNPKQVPLGNATPDWHGAVSSTFSIGKFRLYGLLDGSFGRKIWDEGYQWNYGDFMAGTVDQAGVSVEDAKPLGYFYRVGPGLGGSTGVGGLFNALGPNNESVEDASYMKLREMSLTYNVGTVAGQGNWTVGVTGRNLHTWTNYRGYDPEVGRAAGTELNNAALVGVDYFGFPNLRTFTLTLSTAF
jgi:TonB-linked SusC/RagA family outer membrane protein